MSEYFIKLARYIEQFRPNLANCLINWYKNNSHSDCTDVSLEEILYSLQFVGYNKEKLYNLITA